MGKRVWAGVVLAGRVLLGLLLTLYAAFYLYICLSGNVHRLFYKYVGAGMAARVATWMGMGVIAWGTYRYWCNLLPRKPR